MNPLFIVGAQRSGTTMLRLMLNSHPQVAIPEEGTFLMPLLRKVRSGGDFTLTSQSLKRFLSYIEKNAQFQLWGMDGSELFNSLQRQGECSSRGLVEQLYLMYAKMEGKLYWGDKSPTFFRMIPAIDKLFPNAKFVHLIRDGRDIYLSWRKMDPRRSNIRLSALEWSYKVQRANRDLNALNSNRVLKVRYEDLVKEPESILSQICEFWGVEFRDEMLSYWKESKKYIGQHHSKLIFSPPSQESIGNWKVQLSSSDVRAYECVAEDCLKNHGYELSSSRPFSWQEKFLNKVSLVVPSIVRVCQVMYIALLLDFSARFGLATDAAGRGEMPSEARRKKIEKS